MTQSANDYVVLGIIGSTYGVKGWLKVISYAEMISNVLDYPSWYIEDGNGWKIVKIENSQEHGKGLIVKLAGLENPEQARLLSGKKFAVLRSQLPTLAKDEYYWSDLQGLTVIDQHGETLGTVSYLMETGANDVLVVKGKKEHAIPYLPNQVVKSIDLEKKVMRVDWDLI